MRVKLHAVRPGIVLGALALLYGFGLGVFFGAGEHWLRDGQREDAEAHFEVYRAAQPDEEAARAEMERTLTNTWRYWLRAHFHAGGIGAVAIGLSLVLSLLSVKPGLKTLGSLLLGIGAVGYPIFWMWAGMRAPAMGGTAIAKESLRWFAIPTAGAAFAGVALTLAIVIRELFLTPTDTAGE